MSSKFQTKTFGLKLRNNGSQPSIFVRSVGPITRTRQRENACEIRFAVDTLVMTAYPGQAAAPGRRAVSRQMSSHFHSSGPQISSACSIVARRAA